MQALPPRYGPPDATRAPRYTGVRTFARCPYVSDPADVDVAELYDGFSFLSMVWLEALGFCGKGESGPFIEGGKRIALEGELPLNTSGGQLSGGRLHGFGFIHEACVQLCGEGGDRHPSHMRTRAPASVSRSRPLPHCTPPRRAIPCGSSRDPV